MGKFAVAFVEEKLLKHDKVILEEATHDVVYYNGNIEVVRLPNYGVGHVIGTELHQVIEEAENESQAMKSVRERWGYHIICMTATQI